MNKDDKESIKKILEIYDDLESSTNEFRANLINLIHKYTGEEDAMDFVFMLNRQLKSVDQLLLAVSGDKPILEDVADKLI
jgi:hypothetical protein